MKQSRLTRLTLALPLAVVAGLLPTQGQGQSNAPSVTAKPGEWRYLNADPLSTRYSPLDQINRENFSKLKIAWRLTTNDFGPRPDTLYSATPLFVDSSPM